MRPGTKYCRPRLAAGLLCILLWVVGGSAVSAQELNLPAFFGQWQGTGISETDDSIYFRVTSRDMDVRIGANDQGGFNIEWATVQRQRGAADDPQAQRRTTALTFLPTGRRNVWKAADAGDPMSGTYAWAALQGRTLTINTFVIAPDGGFRLHVYNRTLSGLGMELDFVAIADGEPARSVKARLVKVGN